MPNVHFVQLITLGLGPLFWTPFADRWGRLPVWLVSALGSALFNIGCSESTSYASHMVCRLFQGFFISPGITLVQGVVVDMFFAKHRGQKMVSSPQTVVVLVKDSNTNV